MNDIGSNDAAIYNCAASNGHKTMDIPTILVVTGIVPYFAQAPNSYVALPTYPDAYYTLSFEISIKPENGDGYYQSIKLANIKLCLFCVLGLILYNGNQGNNKTGDFISLSLTNSLPEFRFNLRNNVTIVKAANPLSLGQWHTIKIVRSRKKGLDEIIFFSIL